MRPWRDTLDDGSLYPRNAHTNVCGSSAVPEEWQRVPFGYGASIFDLGQQPAFVRALLGDGGGSEAVAKAMAGALPAGCPRTVRVQLCTQDLPGSASLDSGPEFANCVLLVWGHHAPSAVALQAQLQASIEDAASAVALDPRCAAYTVAEAVQAISRPKSECNNSSRRFRRHVADEILRVLEDGFFLTGGACGQNETVSRYDTINIDQMHTIPEPDGTVTSLCDYNVGPDALVFHSPARGCTLFSHETPSCQVVLPGSDGRLASAVDLGNNTLAEALDSLALTAPSHASTAVQCMPNVNRFTSIDEAEGSYRRQLATLYAANASGCNAHCLRAIATAFPQVQRMNGKLDGIRTCDTIETLVSSLSSACTQILIPNTENWRQQLTAADEMTRPYFYMNAETARFGEDGAMTHFVVDRASLEGARN